MFLEFYILCGLFSGVFIISDLIIYSFESVILFFAAEFEASISGPSPYSSSYLLPVDARRNYLSSTAKIDLNLNELFIAFQAADFPAWSPSKQKTIFEV